LTVPRTQQRIDLLTGLSALSWVLKETEQFTAVILNRSTNFDISASIKWFLEGMTSALEV